MYMSHTIAVDIGGTQIRVALYEPDSIKPVAHKRTRSLANQPGVYERLERAIESVWPQDGVKAIGIASPGPLDPHSGTILATPNIPEWQDFPLTAKLSQHFNVPAYLDNDANMAGLAEWQFGAGKGHQDLVYLTISTGIGGGVITNGCLLQGFRGMGAELGHIIIDPEGPLCGCGRRGHIESFSSGPSIRAMWRNNLLPAKNHHFSLRQPSLPRTSPRQRAQATRWRSLPSSGRGITWELPLQIFSLFLTHPF